MATEKLMQAKFSGTRCSACRLVIVKDEWIFYNWAEKSARHGDCGMAVNSYTNQIRRKTAADNRLHAEQDRVDARRRADEAVRAARIANLPEEAKALLAGMPEEQREAVLAIILG